MLNEGSLGRKAKTPQQLEAEKKRQLEMLSHRGLK